MQLKFAPFVGTLILAASVMPAQVRAEKPNFSPHSVSNSAHTFNLTPGQQSIVSALNLSSEQKAKLQQSGQPITFQQIKPILTAGQREKWLQMRHEFFGGN
ncbi:MAG: hypothetical protein JOZ78_00070 [Chroococcidiopsidaceae cyanobacterium CP_BM_ER_R8_30]|nr:hypothetical protein [Chroococcidiopsidaceae cyanobacterium CP_BM_ER_R8_30]